MLRKSVITLAFSLCGMPSLCLGQTYTPLTHPAPFGVVISLLLTDGTVLVQAQTQAPYVRWYTLTPDKNGSYVNGQWGHPSALPAGYAPFGQSEAVLADGRVVLIGGEYNNFVEDFTNMCAIYDPLTKLWANLTPPDGWDFIGDSPLTVLPDGRVLVGNKLNKSLAVLDPSTLTWTTFRHHGKADFNAEEGWTLMPDGTLITEDVKDAPNTEIYNPTIQTWSSLGPTPVDLHSPGGTEIDYGGPRPYRAPGEVGPAELMPDGSVFATGAIPKGGNCGHTAIYRNGSWHAGPNFPKNDSAADTFEALLPNGHALVTGISGSLFEFDGTSLTREPVNVGFSSLLVLPTGEVLVAGSGVYTSPGSPDPSWAPTITSSPTTITRGATFQIFGAQFNGLSQANVLGDELESASNYPLVRITNGATGHVFYARTHDHSTMGVATGSTTVSTHVDVPATMETGVSELEVVANGIPSAPFVVTVN
jgi:hypothetical protein